VLDRDFEPSAHIEWIVGLLLRFALAKPVPVPEALARRAESASIGGVADEVFVALPASVAPLRHVRSTLLIGSLATVDEAGYGAVYRQHVPEDALRTIESSVAGMWLPLEIARAHYLACEELGVSAESAATLGRSTLARTKTLLLGTAVAMARNAGVTPWTILTHAQRFWARGCDGGAFGVVQKGPKEALIQLVDCPLVEIRYFRHGLRGLVTGILELVCRKAYLHDERVPHPETSAVYRAQWA
jgi:hypothetical protein